MPVTLQLRQLDVPPGQRLLAREIERSDFKAILNEFGESHAARIAYLSDWFSLGRAKSSAKNCFIAFQERRSAFSL